MALTFPRWLAAALIGCALLAAAVSTRDTARLDDWMRLITPGEKLHIQRSTARARFRSAVDQLRVAELRDSLTAGVAAASPTGTVRIAPQLVSDVAPLFTAALAAETATQSRAIVPADVALVFDAGGMDVSGFEPPVAEAMLEARRARHIWVEAHHVLPSADGQRCLTIVRAGSQGERGMYVARAFLSNVGSVRGVCAYYEAFGMPGPSIDRWLRMRGWTLAGRTAWDKPVGAIAAAKQASPWRLSVGMGGLPTGGMRCAAGDLSACEQAVLEPADGGWPTSSDGIVSPALAPSGELGRTLELSVLSEMVRTLGRERFRRFWQSTESPDVAFRRAAGISLGEWTHDLVTRVYGEQHRGPGVETAGLGAGFLIIILGMVIGLGAAKRRSTV